VISSGSEFHIVARQLWKHTNRQQQMQQQKQSVSSPVTGKRTTTATPTTASTSNAAGRRLASNVSLKVEACIGRPLTTAMACRWPYRRPATTADRNDPSEARVNGVGCQAIHEHSRAPDEQLDVGDWPSDFALRRSCSHCRIIFRLRDVGAQRQSNCE
jgi:hypothetical protein